MITQKTKVIRQREKIETLIKTLEPIAAQYKLLSKAKDALKSIGWSVYHNANSTHVNFWSVDDRIELYDYGKIYRDLPSILDMVRRCLERYTDTDTPQVYTRRLCEFIDDHLGADVECTQKQFNSRKRDVTAALERALKHVKAMRDCADTGVYQFDADKGNES